MIPPILKPVMVVLWFLLSLHAFPQSPSPTSATEPPLPTVDLGFLLPLTGGSASSGREVARGLTEGINDFNRSQNTFRFNPVADFNAVPNPFDTSGDNEIALRKFNDLISTYNLLFVLGIVSSENLKYITQPFSNSRRKRGGNMRPDSDGTDDDDTLFFSCCSTSSNLALPDDNIYRMLPNDSKQARFLAREMVNAGKKAIAVIYRKDEWGTQFQEDTIREFKRLRGVDDETVVANSIGYRVNAMNLRRAVFALSGNVQVLVASFSREEVAVISFGFGRDTSRLYEAAFDRNDILRQLRWFGVDLYPDVINSQKARDFAQLPEVRLETSLVAVNRIHPQFKSLNEKLRSPPNIQASPYAFAAYDSVQILGNALLESGIDIEGLGVNDFAVLKTALNIVARNYNGLLGNGTLDENGDLASSNYELWRIRNDNWVRVAGENSGAEITVPLVLLTGILAALSLSL